MIKALLAVAAATATYFWLGTVAAVLVALPIVAFAVRRVVLGRSSESGPSAG